MDAKRSNVLLLLVAIYGLASLFHYAHNAAFLDEYPNMPSRLSAAWIYLAGVSVAAVGCAGYWLVRRGLPLVGLIVIGIYAALGFDGFAHYTLAPMAMHTSTMNLTIWLEAATGAILLLYVGALVLIRLRATRGTASSAL